MDFQRNYEKKESERAMVGMIVAELNDIRDLVKNKLGNTYFSKTYVKSIQIQT